MPSRDDRGRPDADLVRAALLGAKEPLAELITRHWETAVALAARVLDSPELARDAAQEATVSAMTGLGQLRSPERFGAWFCGIALNVARRWLRQLRQESVGLPAADLISGAPGPAEAAEIADLASRVRAAITALPDGQRNAVLLFYLQGLSHREVAAELGISAGAVKARLHQARAALAPRLSQLAGLQLAGLPEGKPMTTAETPELVRVAVAGLRRSDDVPQPKHLMLLEECDGDRRLPIWIGPAEATAMAISLESVEQPRPMTYGLAASLVQAAGAQLREVRITRLTGSVFYATVVVAGPAGAREVDARPSDAVNLALAADIPVLVDSRLFSDEITAHYAEAAAYPTGSAELAAEVRQRLDELMREVREAHPAE